MTKEQPNNKQLALLLCGLLIPVSATTHLLDFVLPESLAFAISIFMWTFAVYWIPPRPKMSYWRWLIIVFLISAGGFVWVALGLRPY